MKVLFIASDFKPKPGGRADYIDNLAKGLIERGVSTKVLAVYPEHNQERLEFLRHYADWVVPFPVSHDERPRHWLPNKVVSLLEIARCRVTKLRPVLNRTRYFAQSAVALRRVERVLEEERPTVVVFGHVDLRLYWLALLLIEKQISYVVIAHESEIYRFSARRNECVRKATTLEGAKAIAANSRHTRRLVEMWNIPPERISIVYPPVAKEAIESAVPNERRWLHEGELRIVTICRLVKPKGIDIAIRALAIIDGQGIPFQYVIAGDGPEKAALHSLARQLGVLNKIQFRGYISNEEKWQLLNDSDVFVMPSRVNPKMQHEGFGIAFVEAAAVGLPAIGSKAGGIPDAIVNGETGILVREESPEELAEALVYLYRNPDKRCEMGRVGMERARTQFSPTAVAARFEKEVLQAV